MAETTTAAWWPASTSRLTRSATALMRSISATDVPPNFITMRVLPAALVIGQDPGMLAAAPHPLPGGRRVSILNRQAAKQGPPEGRSSLMSSAAPPESPLDPSANSLAASVDPAEVEKFSNLAESWWDPNGKFRPLHRLNPIRLGFIRDGAAVRFGRDPLSPRPLAGLGLVDIGCGGGILSEPLARLGARVTGIDAAETSIAAARRHAAESELEIAYRLSTAEGLAETGAGFEIVLAMEIIEHVSDVEGFVAAAARLVAPGGLLILSTLNRTAKSFALAILGAEYLLRWLPPGTHDWRRFLRPSEVAAAVRPHGLALAEAIGVVYSPLTDKWRPAAGDLDVNYMMCFERS